MEGARARPRLLRVAATRAGIAFALAALTLAVFVQVRHHDFADYGDYGGVGSVSAPKALLDSTRTRQNGGRAAVTGVSRALRPGAEKEGACIPEPMRRRSPTNRR